MAAAMGMQQLVLVVVALLALWCGAAFSAAAVTTKPRKPVVGKAMSGMIPSSGRFEMIRPGFHKRKYEVACEEEGKAKGGPPGCYVGCPPNCPNKCLVFCKYCMSFCMCDIFPGTSCGDPRFTGGDGNTFYFHGKRDENFCILSDAALHINAHFIGNHNPDLKRDFTWVQALGVLFGEEQRHRLYIGARKAVEWDEEEDHIQIIFDGEPVEVDAVKNARWASKGGLSVTRLGAVNTVVVELDGVFSISANAVPITDEDDRIHKYGKKAASDSLVHLDLGFKFHAPLTAHVDGVLGQTYRPDYVNRLNISAKMPIMGGAPKYILPAGAGLFSTHCAVSRFHIHNRHRKPTTTTVVSYAS